MLLQPSKETGAMSVEGLRRRNLAAGRASKELGVAATASEHGVRCAASMLVGTLRGPECTVLVVGE